MGVNSHFKLEISVCNATDDKLLICNVGLLGFDMTTELQEKLTVQ